MPDRSAATVTRPSLDGLVEALDRVIGGGAAVVGDLVVAVDGIDLIRVDLRLLVTGLQGDRTEAS
jgi:hypothetical protein